MKPDNFLESITSKASRRPTNEEQAQFLFFERGISLKEFQELPLPYILAMIKCHNFKCEEEKKLMDKNKIKRK